VQIFPQVQNHRAANAHKLTHTQKSILCTHTAKLVEMVQLLACFAALWALLCVSEVGAVGARRYKVHDHVDVAANTVGPFNNPTETYPVRFCNENQTYVRSRLLQKLSRSAHSCTMTFIEYHHVVSHLAFSVF
jgi:hypothetical protein